MVRRLGSRIFGGVFGLVLMTAVGVRADETGLRVHRVEAGETLSEIAQDALGSAEKGSRLLQILNGLDDPSRLAVGQTLRIPTHPASLLEPWGVAADACVDFSSSGFELREKPDPGRLLVGISCYPDEPGFATRHRVVKIGADSRELIFDSATAAPGDSDLQGWVDVLEVWWFLDLDGDGGADLLGEMSQGSVNNTTQVVFHQREDGYRPCLLFESVSLGDVTERRDAEGAIVFEVRGRDATDDRDLAWSELRRGACR